MTFREITWKMFRAEIKNYQLFITCNIMVIGVLFGFISLSVNKQFMDYSLVDPMISSNIYAPAYILLLFSGIFIPYTQNAFMKARQKDYGILLSLGMTEQEVKVQVVIENLILSMISLLGGLAAGTGLSLLFLFIIREIIGISGIHMALSFSAYQMTAAYSFGIFVISLLFNLFGMLRSTIYEKLKYAQKAERGKHYHIFFAMAGVVITIGALMIMVLFYRNNNDVWFMSILVCVIGSILIFYHGEAFLEYYQKRHRKSYTKNLFLMSDMKYYYGKNKKIFLAITWIFFTMFFFLLLGLVNYPALIKNSRTYHPYHLAYGEIKNQFAGLRKEEVVQIAHNNGNEVTDYETVRFVRSNAFTVFEIGEINHSLNKDYQVSPNTFLLVYPYDLEDGYDHSMQLDIADINVSSEDGERQLHRKGSIADPLFGSIHCISDYILLVDHDTFQWLMDHKTDYYMKGTLQLYHFSRWQSSKAIVNAVEKKLMQKNSMEQLETFYKVSSRIEAEQTAAKSASFLIFLIACICLLFYACAIIMIHFKLKMEYQEEQKKYRGLYRIGMKNQEMKKMISQKILVLFLISFLYAMTVNLAYSYDTFQTSGYGTTGILYAILTTVCFLGIHLSVYRVYSCRYYNETVMDLGLK